MIRRSLLLNSPPWSSSLYLSLPRSPFSVPSLPKSPIAPGFEIFKRKRSKGLISHFFCVLAPWFRADADAVAFSSCTAVVFLQLSVGRSMVSLIDFRSNVFPTDILRRRQQYLATQEAKDEGEGRTWPLSVRINITAVTPSKTKPLHLERNAWPMSKRKPRNTPHALLYLYCTPTEKGTERGGNLSRPNPATSPPPPTPNPPWITQQNFRAVGGLGPSVNTARAD